MLAIFQKKEKSLKGQNIWKYEQKYTKFENRAGDCMSVFAWKKLCDCNSYVQENLRVL